MSEDFKTRQILYRELKEELYKRQLSNSESFDKAVLSLSSAGLAISLTFIRNIISLDKASGVIYLEWSWFLFGAAIVSTIFSLMSSQLGLKKQLDIAKRYYLESDDNALNDTNVFSTSTEVLNWFSGISFVGAISLVIIFATLNI